MKSSEFKNTNVLVGGAMLAFALFIKLVIFNYYCFGGIMVSSLWTNTKMFMSFYLPKIGMAVLFTGFCFLFGRRIWIAITLFIVDLLIISQLVYFRANGILLDAWAVTMAGNMDGFWDSVWMFIEVKDLLFIVISLLCCLFVCFFCGKFIRNYKIALYGILFGIILNVCGACCVNEVRGGLISEEKSRLFCFYPMSDKCYAVYYNNDPAMFCSDFSLIHYEILQCQNLAKIFLTEEEKPVVYDDEMSSFINKNAKDYHKTPIIICLIESLESWGVREDVMPCLYNFANNHANVLYVKNVKAQKMAGSSSDGQLIVETGLLPISDGAVSFRYPHNVFPSINSLYEDEKSATLIPHNLTVWNQAMMNKAYKYDTAYVCSMWDYEIFGKLCDLSHLYSSILTFNNSSHNPFTLYADSAKIQLPADMPMYMSNYLKALNYVDEGINVFLENIDNDSILSKFTIVITADHNVFSQDKKEQFYEYCLNMNLDYDVIDPNCPLIIYSPNIKESIVVEEYAYQMDIFPTVLDILNADYYWKGFGVSLMNPDFNNNRLITEEQAFLLSDRVIRSDYFKKFKGVK